MAALTVGPAKANEAEASANALRIAVLISTRADLCHDPGDVRAIRRLAAAARNSVNASGGLAGRRLDLQFYDDEADAKKTIANVRQAIADPRTIAMIGLTNSSRAKELFETAGAEIGASGIPWISNISVNSLFEDYSNVFTMRGAQEYDSIPVMAQFVRDMRYRRLAFVGVKEQVAGSALGDGLKERLGAGSFVTDYRLTLKDDEFDPADKAAMIEELKRTTPDFLFLASGSRRVAELLNDLEKAEIRLPAFVSGRIENIFAAGPVAYSANLYQLAWDGLPDAFNDRLRQRIFRSPTGTLTFEGRRNASAPGWSNGECKERPPGAETDALSSGNLRAVALGLQFADMVAMSGEILKSAEQEEDVPALRARLARGITTDYAAGRGVFPGELENWSFRPESRAAARTPFIVTRPKSLGTEQLAPTQYVALRNETMRQIQTLYMDIDLTRAFRINDAEKSFSAEFYLSMSLQKNESLDQIEFANAFIDPLTNNKQITVRPLHLGGASDAYPSDMRIYTVSGKFMFSPDFSNYPFDTQRFSIDLRSKSGDAPFIIQPTPDRLRDNTVMTESWDMKYQYVGYDEDFLPVIDARSHERSIVPFYKGSFVWVMKREATDYFLTVVVPLAFIMIIAYLSIFIPRVHFEAIVTIQVTALLSAVALYITIPKVDADDATISDKIFLFDYMLISLMIGISILRVNRHVEGIVWFRQALTAFHVLVIPLLVGVMALYVIGSSMAEGQAASSLLGALRLALF